MCGVTAFRLNPASSSCPSSRPLRRSRMLARCAAPPSGSWGPWEDAAPSPDTAALGAGGPRVQRGWEARVMWKARPRSAPRRRAHPGDTGAQPRVALRKLSASPGVWCFLPAEGASVKGDLFCFLEEEATYFITLNFFPPGFQFGSLRFVDLCKPSPALCCFRPSPMGGFP